MPKRIVYKTPEGGVAIIIPAMDSALTVEQIAARDVPTGLPYKIVNTADVLSDRQWRRTWTVADVDLTDGVGV